MIFIYIYNKINKIKNIIFVVRKEIKPDKFFIKFQSK